jgi:hypothetical protein
MLHKLSGSYSQIAKHIPELAGLLSSSANKKQQLLEMARQGEKRPSARTQLGQALYNYLRKSSEFTNEIKRIRPDWLVSKSDHNKQLLLDFARKGKPRPNIKTQLGGALKNYTLPNSVSYDPIFAKKIKNFRPDWFLRKSHLKRQQLLEMARKKLPKPDHNTQLGKALKKYTLKTSGGYNAVFDKKIRKLAPNWFISRYDAVNEKKRQLLEMARKKLPKPSQRTQIGRALGKYTWNKSESYDPVFAKQIKKIRPDWFTSQTQIANQKKQQLLEMARKKLPRPDRKTQLGGALNNYAFPKSVSYDPIFAKKIKKLAPHWFKRRCSTN